MVLLMTEPPERSRRGHAIISTKWSSHAVTIAFMMIEISTVAMIPYPANKLWSDAGSPRPAQKGRAPYPHLGLGSKENV